ncbi:Uncharacterised protein [uncultured archaeon]|nr:Uncharacterised protein [uncultured archaeon]
MIEFWKSWKLTPLEKSGVKSLKSGLKVVLKKVPKVVAVYAGGSFVRREMNAKSDVDVWVITSDLRSQKIVEKLSFPMVGFSGYALQELKSGKQSAFRSRLMISPMRFVKYLPNFRLIYGKPLGKFPVRSDVEDLKALISVFRTKFLPLYASGKFSFQSVLKQVFWLADLELKLKGKHPPHSWKAIALMTGKDHIACLAWKLRGRHSSDRVKKLFIARLKKYLEGLC